MEVYILMVPMWFGFCLVAVAVVAGLAEAANKIVDAIKQKNKGDGEDTNANP